MNSTLQIIWDCLDIPNKETVEFVRFVVEAYNHNFCVIYQDITEGDGELSCNITEEIKLQKVLKNLPNARGFVVRRLERLCPYQWDEEKQKMRITT